MERNFEEIFPKSFAITATHRSPVEANLKKHLSRNKFGKCFPTKHIPQIVVFFRSFTIVKNTV